MGSVTQIDPTLHLALTSNDERMDPRVEQSSPEDDGLSTIFFERGDACGERESMRSILFSIFLSVLCSCAQATKKPAEAPKSDRRSIVFGRVQFDDTTPVSYVAVQNNLRFYLFRNGERVHVWPDGFFYAENVLRGTYDLESVYSEKFGYRLPTKIYEEKLVASTTAQYLGSYQVKPLKIGDPARGVIAKKLDNEELILLERVRQEVKGTTWEEMIDKRLSELRPSSQPSNPPSSQSQP